MLADHINVFFLLHLIIYLTCVGGTHMEGISRGQLSEVDFLLLSCGFWLSNPGSQA